MNRPKRDPAGSLEQSRNQAEMSDLLSSARGILVASEAQEWQRVSDLVMNWQGALHLFFENNSDTKDSRYTVDDVRQLNEINAHVIALVEECRDGLSRKLKALKEGREAVSAYHAISKN